MRRSTLADVAHFLLQHLTIELDERQARKKLDATPEDAGYPRELVPLLFIGSFEQRRVFDAAMGGHRLPRPNFARGGRPSLLQRQRCSGSRG